MRKRYSFLTEQAADLERASRDLRRIVTELSWFVIRSCLKGIFTLRKVSSVPFYLLDEVNAMVDEQTSGVSATS